MSTRRKKCAVKGSWKNGRGVCSDFKLSDQDSLPGTEKVTCAFKQRNLKEVEQLVKQTSGKRIPGVARVEAKSSFLGTLEDTVEIRSVEGSKSQKTS